MSDDLNLLQRKAREWALKVVELHKTQVPESQRAEKDRLLNWAKTIKKTVENFTGPLDELSSMNELGLLPLLVGAAGIAAVTGMIAKWTYDYNKYRLKITSVNALMADGMSREQAITTVNSLESKTLSGNLSNMIKYSLMAGAAFIVAKKIGVI